MAKLGDKLAVKVSRTTLAESITSRYNTCYGHYTLEVRGIGNDDPLPPRLAFVCARAFTDFITDHAGDETDDVIDLTSIKRLPNPGYFAISVFLHLIR